MTRNLGRKFMHPKSQDPQFRVFDRDLWSSLLNNSFSSICNLMWTLNWGLLSSGPCIDRLFHRRGPALGCAWEWIRVKQLLLTWMLLVRLDCFFKSWNHFLHWNVPYWKFCDCINCDQIFLLWNVNLITEEFKYFRKVYSTWYELYECYWRSHIVCHSKVSNRWYIGCVCTSLQKMKLNHFKAYKL